ncbi:MAG: hypothetical protein J6A33_07975 [Alphaproteobacteria bacterium]|nr:hypothetical protein [Alphaproteobacteria bacterium]
MKLYKEIPENKVLETVFKILSNTRSSLVVSKLEDEKDNVRPDEEYFRLLQKLLENGVSVTRYYFGSQQGFEREKRDNPDVKNIYGGEKESYQRLIVSDEKQSMSKIGNQFVYSEHPLWITMLKGCLQKERVSE